MSLLLPLSISLAHAETSQNHFANIKNGLSKLIAPEPTRSAHSVDITSLSRYSLDTSQVAELPQITRPQQGQSATGPIVAPIPQKMNVVEAIHTAVQRRPEISQSISTLSAQAANIDVAKAAYYPQLSGGLGTGDLTSGERGRQVVSLNATQMLYDFGKIKTNVSIEEARLAEEQARVLVSLDQVAFEVADAIVNIKRYQEITKIAQQQIQGIGRIAEIANLRARAGISSQADPIQAQSNLEAAQSNLLVQQTQLRQYQQRLRTLLGFDVSAVEWEIPERIVAQADLYQDPEFTQIPNMILAHAGVNVARLQKDQARLSRYPSIHLKGSLSQAVNGRNPNNNEDDGFYNSIMIEASSNFYQGGAARSQARSASYAEEAARAQVNTVYLDVLDQVRLIREQIENKQKQMGVLSQRRATTVRAKELYQEQYKLGTRTVVDLLNAEQAIHSAAQEIESARYDIYSAIVQYIQVTGRTRDIYALNRISIQGFEVQP
ncbi:TolC family protein [Acinetobacter pseudolwoffii]|uniref:TolC family protein n=1 Tax=Acinetobacter sp. YH12255 TaxID=2601179 RepID=UPI00211F41E3|nr:TolC family protein [Acinetobacter sp. YH12255]